MFKSSDFINIPPPKFKIDTQNSHIWKEMHVWVSIPSFLVSMRWISGVYIFAPYFVSICCFLPKRKNRKSFGVKSRRELSCLRDFGAFFQISQKICRFLGPLGDQLDTKGVTCCFPNFLRGFWWGSGYASWMVSCVVGHLSTWNFCDMTRKPGVFQPFRSFQPTFGHLGIMVPSWLKSLTIQPGASI